MSDAVAGSQPGYIDERLLCSTSGEICPARQSLVDSYEATSDFVDTAALPVEVQPRFDGSKLQARLIEYGIAARAIDCGGPDDTVCPVRQSMNQSATRTTVVSSLRRLLRKNS